MLKSKIGDEDILEEGEQEEGVMGEEGREFSEGLGRERGGTRSEVWGTADVGEGRLFSLPNLEGSFRLFILLCRLFPSF